MEKIFTMVEWQGYWKLMKLIIGRSKCGKIRYNRSIAIHWKSMELVIESSKRGKNRYNCRIAELLEINQVDHREWQMWKKRL